MPRRNIYVDEELDAQIERYELAVSQIAQDALRREARRRGLLSGSDQEINRVAARLIADREQTNEIQYQAGFDVGGRWAKESASWEDLSYFKRYATRDRRGMTVDLRETHGLRRSLTSWAVSTHPDADYDETWFETLNGDAPFERGVLDAVITILQSVEDLVQPAVEDL